MSAEMHDELVMFERYQIKSTNQNKKLLKNVYSKHIYVYMNGEEHIRIYIYNREKQIHIYSYTHIYIHINQ